MAIAASPSSTDLGLSLDSREGNIILNAVVTKGRFYLFLKTAQTTDMEAAVIQLRMSTAQESSHLLREVHRLKKKTTTPEDIDKIALPFITELCRNNSVGFYMGELPSDTSEGMVLQRVA